MTALLKNEWRRHSMEQAKLNKTPATDPYLDYWRRKRMMETELPAFPIRHWWKDEHLCEIEKLYFDSISHCTSLLDFGAGDLRLKKKFQASGFAGQYETLDIGQEFNHTYSALSEVRRTYQAVLCLDVIEHMTLHDGLSLLQQLAQLVEPGGVLIVQTPNARCIRHPLSWDMTHVQCYNVAELWACLRCLGFAVDGYRVVFSLRSPKFVHRITPFASMCFISRLLGSDYADNLSMIATRPQNRLEVRRD